MAGPGWLSEINLITFDCFGTLIDWRSGLDRVEIASRADFETFERECIEQQKSEVFQPYARILKQAIAKARPSLRPAVGGLFADDFGRQPPFADAARALATLAQLVKIGILTNSDANHQLDVAATLRVAWDVCITSQEIRAYKPGERAWDAMVRMAVARAAVPRDHWLHVSASTFYDLVPARGRGLRTCLVRRPGLEEKATADLVVESLDELVDQVRSAKRGPVLLTVRTRVADEALRGQVRQWLATAEISAMRAIPGVRGARLIEEPEGALVEEYVFGGEPEYENYLANFSAEHRGALRERFGAPVERSFHKALLCAAA